MSITYVASRLLVFAIVVWMAVTLIFFLPRLAGDRNPVRERLILAAASGRSAAGIEEQVAAFERDFGLDQPLLIQYLRYMGGLFRGDLGFSLIKHPATVSGLILDRLPWTLGLVGVSLVLSFVFGSIAGALLAWTGNSVWLKGFKGLAPVLLTTSAIPYFMIALLFMFTFAVNWKLLPIAGASDITTVYDGWSLGRVWDIIYHSILPASAIVAAQVGFWALQMRGMMVTTVGEDYVTLAQTRGLNPTRVFLQYAMRNALLPQTTSLALALSLIVSGVILVEIIYRYPGMGTLMYEAIGAFDYFVIYGVVLVLILAVAVATLVLDFVYPLIDPRIKREV